MQVDPILDNDRLSANDDLEMVEQHEVGDPVQQGMSQEEQEAFDLKTQGYCITGWNQICHTGEVAKARREERAERQQKRKDSNLAAYNRNKDHVINRLNREIESKNLEIQSQYLKISELNAAQKEMRREHQAELESHDHREALLLADLREACQANDEEVEALKETIDRQALPPAYADINNQAHTPKATDGGPADVRTVISSAIISLREAIAAPKPDRHTNPLIHVADTLRSSLRTIKRGQKPKLWPPSTTALALHAVHECVDRVVMYLSLHPELYAHLSLPPSFLNRLPSIAKRAHTALRKAFAAADALATEFCSLHFASGGRRAQLAGSASSSRLAVPTPNSMLDPNDDFLDLQYWKKRFEGVRQEAQDWNSEVGAVVFDGTIAWLEQEILSTV
ncbi:hypothetical protein KCU95_g18024, partial [Aureobasidium melanogenum]